VSAALPAGACDSHCHVIGPHELFPLAQGSGDIRDGSCMIHLAMLDALGLDRALIVHPSSVYGGDHAAFLSALAAGGSRYRGVAVARADVSDAQLDAWMQAGVCALRFVAVKTPQGLPFPGSAGFDDLIALAPRLRERGMHAQVWADCRDTLAHEAQLVKLGIPIVLDHMGRMDVAAGASGADFQRLCALVGDGHVFVKLTLCRNSKQRPGYEELRPFHDALVAANPEALVWGSDWPHLRMGEETPDPQALLDVFRAWVADAAIERKILIETPQRLFGFTPARHD
jgi:predicted TIM-barrel fold metal-dependent hydrolase